MYSEEVTKNITEGAKFYAAKDYDLAASHYADACGTFNEENGADDPDLLLLYGKALFHNGVAKSSVLGGVGNTQTKEKVDDDNEDANKEGDDNFQFEDGFAEEDNDEHDHDENEYGNENEPNEEADDQSDFEAAWEILDLARSLFSHNVEELSSEKTNLETPYLKNDDDQSDSPYVTALQKLSETYDLLGEVSLESENFPQAASDLQSCLDLRVQLYDPKMSALVSESHYKLSLALELCVDDPELRKKAAAHMKLAIVCVKNRSAAKTDEAAKAETRELLRDLQERYKELEKDPQQEIQVHQMDMIKGLLGEAIGSSGATDLSSMVNKKAPAPVNDLSSMVKKRRAGSNRGNEKKPRKE